MVALVLVVNASPLEAQSDTGTDGSVVAAYQESIQRVSGPGVTVSNGPVYACYFAAQFTDARGETRQGDDFIADTTGPELAIGQFYARQCLDETGAVADFGVIQYDPTAPDDIVTEITIRDLLSTEDIPAEAFVLDLSPAAEQITGLETWIDQPGPTTLGPEYASAGPISVGVRANLREVVIDPGDGSGTFACTADEFTAWVAGTTDPACSYTYIEEPASGSYEMTAEFIWDYQWLPDGAGAWVLEPFFVDSEDVAFDVAVIDLEAVITR